MSANDRPAGLSGFTLSAQDKQHPVWLRLQAALNEELVAMRGKNDSASLNVADTTLLRGEIRLAKRILARADEVGPESRQAEPQWPEPASSARAAAGLPEGF